MRCMHCTVLKFLMGIFHKCQINLATLMQNVNKPIYKQRKTRPYKKRGQKTFWIEAKKAEAIHKSNKLFLVIWNFYVKRTVFLSHTL